MPDLKQIQQYFTANNIYQITQQTNGSLLITFDAGSDDNSSQTITEEEQSNETDKDKKSVWQKLKSYLKGKGKSSLNKQELETLINGSPSQGDHKPFNWTPWLIGGGIILVLVIVIGYLLLRDKEKGIK
ncbi:MAG: hypothetical protein MRERV_2c033 [Mycoplasmataceae bacterium RV_VA103A]|nr:MAG: hypothetical protein MRERV_2c033 [Mycoplasmataceae bacterium RV_VA103A]